MTKKLLFVLTSFLLLTHFSFGQEKFKEYFLEEIGMKISMPKSIEITDMSNDMITMENDDFLIFIEQVDKFQTLQSLFREWEIKEIVIEEEKVNEESFTGVAGGGFDADGVFNVFGNVRSKYNEQERIAFDISIYNYNEKTEEILEDIMGSIEFVDLDEYYASLDEDYYDDEDEYDDEDDDDYDDDDEDEDDDEEYYASKRKSNNSSIAKNNSNSGKGKASAPKEVPAPTKKRGFFSQIMDIAGPIIEAVVPGGKVATGIIRAITD